MNMRNYIAALLVISIVSVTAVAQPPRVGLAASPVQAKLVVPDTRLLPGVPFEMWVEARNPSDASVILGLCADMIVKPEGAEPFTITFGEHEGPAYPTLLPERDWMDQAVYDLVMRPRQSQTLTVPILPELQGPIYFNDDRLSNPGRYTISLKLDYCYSPSVVRKPPPAFLGAAITNEVTIERIIPTGIDASVWERMQQAANGKWIPTRWDPPIINEILTKYPKSNYFPYAVVAASFGMRPETYYQYVSRAVEQFPQSPVFEVLSVSLYRQMGSSCAIKKGQSLRLCQLVEARVNGSKRPTTRIQAFGREDVPPLPCNPHEECVD